MSMFTLWAVRYEADGEEHLAGKYPDEGQAEQARQALAGEGLNAWITEETWHVDADGATQVGGPEVLHGSWLRLIGSLADTLSALGAGQFISLHSSSEHWVQFMAIAGGLRAEAVGNRYLDDDNQLDDGQEAALEALGWCPPVDADNIERAQNWYLELAAPVSFTEMAGIAVRTLAGVYGVGYPQDLTYLAFDGNLPRGERDLSFPDLGVALYRSDPEVGGALTNHPAFDVKEHLLDALRELDPDLPDWDESEPVTLSCGSVPVTLQVAGDPPIVRVWSPVLTGVTETVHLLRELNDINAQISFARLPLTPDGTIVVAAEHHGLPFVPKHFLRTLARLGRLADNLQARLRARHGGTPTLQADGECSERAAAPGYL